MENIIQLLAFVLPIIAVSSVFLILSINLYLKLRRHFLVRVNCWFCNQWTKVHYDERSSFECPTCLQYNGFNSDGDYNRPIPAQHDELFNQQLPFSKKIDGYSSTASSNGLCHLCNNNQQLKIYQLANFIPLNEANYDVEIEHFQKQLEKAYKLCPPCENVVNTTVQKQICLLGLKFTDLRKKGVKLLDLNSSYNGISKKSKRLFLMTLIKIALISFACLNLMLVLNRIDFSDKNLKRHTPKWLFNYVLSSKNLCVLIWSQCWNIWEKLLNSTGFNVLLDVYDNFFKNYESLSKYLLEIPLIEKCHIYIGTMWSTFGAPLQPNLLKLENAILLCFVGVLLQFILLLWNDRNNTRKFVSFLLWIGLAGLHWKYPLRQYVNGYVNTLQVVASIFIIASTISAKQSKVQKQKKLKRISKRSVQQQESSKHHLGQFSDCEDETPVENNFTAFTSMKNSSPILQNNKPHINPVFEKRKSLQDFRSATATAKGSLNLSFTSAKSCISDYASVSDTASVFNTSLTEHNLSDSRKDFDIDISLNRLHLGTPRVLNKSPPVSTIYMTKNNVPRPKPVISPAKLRNVTQNSWVAGGFWRDSNGILLPLSNLTNLSRSSSQTSGYASLEPTNYNSLPPSLNNSFCGDLDCNSGFSEPSYCMIPRRNFATGVACHNNDMTRTFYPVLNREQMVYITPCGYNNVFANRNISFINSRFPYNLNKSNLEEASFSMPNTTYKTHKPNGLLNDWFEKDF